MLTITIVAALIAALLNALSTILQRMATGQPDAQRLYKRDFIATVLKQRLWIIGTLLEITGFIAQAAALRKGSLVLVEPLLTTNLIFLMLMLHFRFSMRTGIKEWLAVVAICGGLSSLLVAANPRSGKFLPHATAWVLVTLVTGGVILISVFVVRSKLSDKARAAVGGLGAGINFALTAALTKLVMEQLNFGIGYVLTHWALYGLIVAGLISVMVMQSAYGAGPLAISLPAIEIADPTLSVVFGIFLFGDSVAHNGINMVFEILGAIVVVIGILLMTSSKRIHQTSL